MQAGSTIDLPYLIIGQGLAGSLLAHALDRLGAEILVADPGDACNATRAAAGLLNPFTGPRLKAPAPAEVWFHGAITHWRLLERRLGTPLLHTGPLVRLIRDPQELGMVERRHRDTRTAGLISPPSPPLCSGLNAPLGCAEVRAGQVDLPAFLDATRTWLRDSNRLVSSAVEADSLVFARDGSARWHGRAVRGVIACQGYRSRDWPWLADLPWRMSHGQALVLQRRPELGRLMLSRGKNLIPLDAERVWLGGTYERYGVPTTTPQGQNELLAALEDMLQPCPPVTIREHLAGVRAGNRRGLLFCGRHPDHPALSVFSGLGSRGTLVAPPAALALASHLVQRTPLPATWHLRNYLHPEPLG